MNSTRAPMAAWVLAHPVHGTQALGCLGWGCGCELTWNDGWSCLSWSTGPGGS